MRPHQLVLELFCTSLSKMVIFLSHIDRLTAIVGDSARASRSLGPRIAKRLRRIHEARILRDFLANSAPSQFVYGGPRYNMPCRWQRLG